MLTRRLQLSGVYQLHCYNFTGEDFEYSLRLIEPLAGSGDNQGATPIQPGKTITNNILVREDFGVFEFDAREGDAVNVFLVMPQDLNCPRVIASDGSDITGSHISCCLDGYNCHVRETRIPQTGTYVIYYKPYYYFATTYSLTYHTHPGPNFYEEGDRDSISPGQVLTNAFNMPGDLDTLRFHANSNDAVTISMKIPGGNFSDKLFMELQGPDGAVIKSTSAHGAERPIFQGVRLNLTGEYMVVCHDVVGSLEFPYTISMVKIPALNISETGDGAEIIQAGEIRRAYLGSGDLDAFTFRAIAGDSVRLAMGSDQLWPTSNLFGPDGSLVAAGHESDERRTDLGLYNSSIWIRCLEQTGDYWIVCSSLLSGSYALSFQPIPECSCFERYESVSCCVPM